MRFLAPLLLAAGAAAVLLGPAPAAAQAPAAVPQDVHAVGPTAGGDDRLFMVRTLTRLPAAGSAPANEGPTFETQVYVRTAGNPFRPFGRPLARRAVAVAPHGEQLAVLLEDGEWLLQSADGVTPARGVAVPNARLLALASDREGLYAVARVPGGAARLTDVLRAATAPATATVEPAAGGTPLPTTVPTTTPAAAATQAATRPAATAAAGGATAPDTGPATAAAAAGARPEPGRSDPLTLLEYGQSGWQPLADVPADVAGPLDAVSLAVLDRTMFLLVRESPDLLRLWRVDDRKWTEVGVAPVRADARLARLIPGGPKPTAWVSPATAGEPDRALIFDPAGLAASRPASSPAAAAGSATPTTGPAVQTKGLVDTVELKPTAGAPPTHRAAAYAFGAFRSLAFAGDTLSEQAYDRATIAATDPARTQVFAPKGFPYFDFVRYTLVTAAMVFAILASLRRRERLQALELDPDELPLAPVGTRLLAGMIDAAPLLVALVLVAVRHGSLVDSPTEAVPTEVWLLPTIGFAIHLLHTTAAELAGGRSLGKIVCGLRVISVDGRPPTKGQVVTRNLLRVIDVGLQFLPLLLVPFSPLRQRAGDAAAGTIVVTAEPKAKADGEDGAAQ